MQQLPQYGKLGTKYLRPSTTIHTNWWHIIVRCKNGIGSAWCHAQQQEWKVKASMSPHVKQS
jgi:hypothetical protein